MDRFRVVSPCLAALSRARLQSGGGVGTRLGQFGPISTVCRRSRLSAIIWINLPSGKGREQHLATPGYGPQRQIEIVGLRSAADNLGLRWTACGRIKIGILAG
jgi:hypothetical protein